MATNLIEQFFEEVKSGKATENAKKLLADYGKKLSDTKEGVVQSFDDFLTEANKDGKIVAADIASAKDFMAKTKTGQKIESLKNLAFSTLFDAGNAIKEGAEKAIDKVEEVATGADDASGKWFSKNKGTLIGAGIAAVVGLMSGNAIVAILALLAAVIIGAFTDKEGMLGGLVSNMFPGDKEKTGGADVEKDKGGTTTDKTTEKTKEPTTEEKAAAEKAAAEKAAAEKAAKPKTYLVEPNGDGLTTDFTVSGDGSLKTNKSFNKDDMKIIGRFTQGSFIAEGVSIARDGHFQDPVKLIPLKIALNNEQKLDLSDPAAKTTLTSIRELALTKKEEAIAQEKDAEKKKQDAAKRAEIEELKFKPKITDVKANEAGAAFNYTFVNQSGEKETRFITGDFATGVRGRTDLVIKSIESKNSNGDIIDHLGQGKAKITSIPKTKDGLEAIENDVDTIKVRNKPDTYKMDEENPVLRQLNQVMKETAITSSKSEAKPETRILLNDQNNNNDDVTLSGVDKDGKFLVNKVEMKGVDGKPVTVSLNSEVSLNLTKGELGNLDTINDKETRAKVEELLKRANQINGGDINMNGKKDDENISFKNADGTPFDHGLAAAVNAAGDKAAKSK